jgi:formate dehydrogenase major subunit
VLSVVLNDQPRQFAAGQSLLHALQGTAAEVPALCDDPRLAPIGGCRLCLVEIEGCPRPCAACTTPLADGMVIRTHTPELEKLRRTQLQLLAEHYPPPPRAETANTPTPFERLIQQYGLEDYLCGVHRPAAIDHSHPTIAVDMSRCITCFRCVRICEEVAGRFVWRAWNRGDRTEIRPAGGVPLAESECVSCGACVDTCPSGALSDKSPLPILPVEREVRTVCAYCGTGCEIHVTATADDVASVRPALESPVSKGHLCVKGRYGWGFINASDRITEPLVRNENSWRKASWAEAYSLIAERFRAIVASHGPDTIGVLGSARATNEENYLTQKFARTVLGTNNVDCCARVCHAPTATGMKLMLGTGAATNSFDDIELARTILVCGANPRDNHPIVGDRIVQQARRGANLIVIDPRQTETSRYATLHLQPHPGTNVPLLNAIAHTILEELLYDPVAREHIAGWDHFRTFVAAFAPERVARICGVDASLIRAAARQYATAKPAMCFHGLGITEHAQGTEGVMCLVNLAILTGNIGIAGAGVNPLRGQNNVQGSAHMGCEPASLTGGVPLDEHRERFESAWQLSLPARPGMNLMQMMDAAAAGDLRALWAIGYDVGLTNPHAEQTLAALQRLEFMVVQDLFMTETARVAGTVFLPACSSLEKDGTFMNSERRIQRVRKLLDPRGDSRPDWRIICDVAQQMGSNTGFQFTGPQQIWDEIRTVWPAGAGITYERLESGGLQWPCPTEEHPGTTMLHQDIFTGDRRLSLREAGFRPTSEAPTAEFPLILVTGRVLYQFNSGTMTGRSATAAFQPIDRLQISPSDADQLELIDGQQVRVSSLYGECILNCQVTQAVRAGELFATFQSPDIFLNRVTGDQRDAMVDTPQYKVTAVRVEPIERGKPIH